MVRGIALDKINSWDDFKSYAEALPNTKSMGDAFEHLTKLYFQINPLYISMYDNVWLLEEVPSKILQYLEIPRQDLGIDLIAQCGSEYHAIQCKYHCNKDTSVNNKEVATFTSLLANKKKLNHGYICSTAIKTSTNYNKLDIQNISNVLYDTWSSLDKDFFDNARGILDKKKPNEKPLTPKPHQENAIKLAHKHFVKENNSRGKLIFPCGSGKSLTGFWMMEKLKANSTLVAVPSLSLVKQTLEVYLKQVVAKNKRVKWLCICSDEGIGKSDDVVTYTRDLPVPCTTDPTYIKEWLKSNKDENIIIFTTYQSGRLIAEISKALKFTFDLGVYDEAHKTVGKNENLFSYLLFEENISVKHRIFMTATERFYRGVRDDVLTMDDPDDYGEVFCHMSFKEAIEEDLLTDYKIITIEVKKEEIAEFIKDNNLVKSNKRWGDKNEARSLASMIALRKAMKALPIKNAVSFHSSIERATRNKDVQEHITDTYNYKPIETYHVSGKLPTTKRNDIVQEFAKSDRALITNSRCLTEGVDVPNIDCIVFADPRKSKVDIVQALGRALRKKDGKDFGYVVLPVIYDHTSHEIDNENFQEILNVVRGLAANDERIIEEFKDKSQKIGRVTGAREEIFSIDQALLEESELVGNLNIKLWEKLSRFNWMPFEEARKYVWKLKLNKQDDWEEFSKSGNKPFDIPSNPDKNYKDQWLSMQDWLGTNPGFKGYEYLSYDQAILIIHKLKLKSQKDWYSYLKSKKKPNNIPSAPSSYYQNKGWTSWGDWLGTGKIADQNKKFKSFSEARKYIQSLNIKSQKEWNSFAKAGGKKPDDIPYKPQRTYKESWKSWGDWLGTGRIADQKKVFCSYEDAKKFARSLKLKSRNEWRNYVKENFIPDNIPKDPFRHYQRILNKLITPKDFLGYEQIKLNTPRKYLSYKEAKKRLKPHKLKSRADYSAKLKNKILGDEFPYNPDRYYKKNGWVSMDDYFSKTSWRDFESVKIYAKKRNIHSGDQWKQHFFNEKVPSDIPKTVQKVYKKYWKGWADFLGKED